MNSELHAKIEQLVNMQNDMKNLLDNINVGIIFLDRKLMIRSFTRDAVRVYRLVASDIGRPLSDIRSLTAGEDLLPAAQNVLETLIPYERELSIDENGWILARIQPYRTLDNMIDGVVLTFTDITQRINAIAAQEALTIAENIVKTIQEPFIVLDANLKVITASNPFYREFRVTPEQTIGKPFYEFANRQWDIPELREVIDVILKRDDSIEDYKLVHNFPGIGKLTLLLNPRRFVGKSAESQMILLSMELMA